MKKIKRILRKFILIRIILRYLNKNNNTNLDSLSKKDIVEALESDSLIDMLGQEERDRWEPRIQLVQESIDNSKIKLTSNAGTFNEDDNLIMHNGLIIDPQSYYGLPMLELLFKNNAIHEPQEEYVFQEILKEIPDSAIMIELGSYWSFYSMWFNSAIKKAKNYMIEPENVEAGIRNFELNKMNGDFTKAYISNCKEKTKLDSETPTICVDDFVEDKNIEFVDILHSDIQGYEFEMLLGAEKLLQRKNVGYLFVSTHSQELHYSCMEHLKLKGYQLVCSSDMNESYSVDGLLVFKNPDYKGLDAIDISKRVVRKKWYYKVYTIIKSIKK